MPDKETFRHVIGHFASGVTVLTTRDGDEDFGATASAVSSLSLEPPMLLVCLNTRSSTQQAIHSSRVLGVNILDEDQGVVAERFASSARPEVRGAEGRARCGRRAAARRLARLLRVPRGGGRPGGNASRVPRRRDARGGPGRLSAHLLPGKVRPLRGRAGPDRLRGAAQQDPEPHVHAGRLARRRHAGQGAGRAAGDGLPRRDEAGGRRAARPRPGAGLPRCSPSPPSRRNRRSTPGARWSWASRRRLWDRCRTGGSRVCGR